MTAGVSPEIERILKTSQPLLVQCRDYRETEARAVVDAVFWNLLQFLNYRMDTTRGNDPSGSYLFAPTERIATESGPEDTGSGKTKTVIDKRDYFEKQLQLDCMRFLRPALGVNVSLEPSDIAGGRADIKATIFRTRLVIEVKREDKDASFESLRIAYGAQATEYSNTSARIGFLLVLDRSREDGSSGYIEDKVKVTTVLKSGDTEPRTLVIVVMPGRRKPPSKQVLREGMPTSLGRDAASGTTPESAARQDSRRRSRVRDS
jgi:hypothetical protein